LNKQILPLDETLQAIEEFAELVWAERTIVLSPPNVLLRRALSDDELVVRRPSHFFSSLYGNRTCSADSSFRAEDDFFIKRRPW
jgi:hypothetical protein